MGFSKALDVNVISAEDLKYNNLFTKRGVYVVVWISGKSQGNKFKTPVSHDGGSNPSWNFAIKFTFDDSLADQNRLSIVFNIMIKRIRPDKKIGEVIVPIKELIGSKLPQSLRYQIRSSTGDSNGFLNFSYKFGDLAPAANGLIYPPQPASGYPYPSPSPSPLQGYAYQPPLQYPGNGAYPTQEGNTPVQQQAPKKNNPRIGLAGVAAKLGGFWVVEELADMPEMDMGGFDF